MENKQTTAPKKGKLKSILIALGVTAATVGGYLGWNWYSNKKKKSVDDNMEETPVKNNTPSTTFSSSSSSSSSNWFSPSSTPARKDEFPLKKGSKGERVKELQQALIGKFGKSILPKYGDDGDFGSEMETALQKAGYPTVVDESTYNVIKKLGAPNYSAIALGLRSAVDTKNFNNAISSLAKLRNISDYSSTNVKFKEYFWLESNPTIVSKMLNAFSTSTQRDSLRKEFLRIGLKFDGSKWTLSGIPDEILLITLEQTEIFDPKRNVKINVPKAMVIGHFLKEEQGWTLFRTLEKNKKLIVKSNKIKIHERN